jgi:hypothetical protein
MVRIKKLFKYFNLYLYKRKLIKIKNKLYKDLDENNHLFI